MARQLINIGTIENDGTGDKLRDAMDKINDNFREVYTELGGDSLSNLDLSGNTISSGNSNGNIILDPNGTGKVLIDNLAITGNTISSTDTNGNITIDPDGTGSIVLSSDVSVTGTLTLSSALSANVTGNLTGDVTGTVSSLSNHDTDDLTEGSGNLYFTTTRARESLSATGSISYDNTSGVISFTDAVTSVNGQTGAVVLSLSDIGVDGQLDGDLVGSVFGDDSTILVDGVNNEVVGPINSSTGTITALTSSGITMATGGGINASTGVIQGEYFYGENAQVENYLAFDSTLLIDGNTGTIYGTIDNSAGASFSGTVDFAGATVTNLTLSSLNADVTGNLTGNVDGDLLGSVFGDDSTLIIDGINKTGTFTELDVDDININGNTITATGSAPQDIVLNVSGFGAVRTNSDSILMAERSSYGVNGVGSPGDVDNIISQDDNYLYKSTAAYDGSTLIWKRAKLRAFTDPLFYIGADDSTMRGIDDLEGIKIIGGTGINTSSDAEGNITIDATGSGGISNVVEDTTPQLGGNLDINGFNIVSVRSNENINIVPNGTGSVVLDGDVTITGTLSGGSPITLGNGVDFDSNDITNLGTLNTHTVPGGTGTLALTSDITTSNLTGTVLSIGADDSTLRAVGVGEGIKIIGGTNVTTSSDSEGNITINATDTGITDVVSDTTPQLGGDLDLNGHSITTARSNEDLNLTPNGTGTVTVNGGLKLEEGVQEKFSSLTGATGTVAHDCSGGNVFYHTSISADFTANFTNLQLETSHATALTLVLVQGGTAYIPTAVQIAGSAQTINWQGGGAPSGTASGIDAVSFTIINNSGTYTVLGQLTDFS